MSSPLLQTPAVRVGLTAALVVAMLAAIAGVISVASRPSPSASRASEPAADAAAETLRPTRLPPSTRPALVVYVVGSEAQAREVARALLEGEAATTGTAAGRELGIVVVVPPEKNVEFALHVAELDYYRLEGGLAAARIEDLRPH